MDDRNLCRLRRRSRLLRRRSRAVGRPARLLRPLPAEVTAQGATVKSEIGSYCVDSEPGDDGSRLRRLRRQELRPPRRRRTRSRSRRGRRCGSSSATARSCRTRSGRRPARSTASIATTGRTRPAGSSCSGPATGWTLKLPKKMRRANTLTIFTRLEGDGDISHLIGLDNSRRQPLQCPGKTGGAGRGGAAARARRRRRDGRGGEPRLRAPRGPRRRQGSARHRGLLREPRQRDRPRRPRRRRRRLLLSRFQAGYSRHTSQRRRGP